MYSYRAGEEISRFYGTPKFVVGLYIVPSHSVHAPMSYFSKIHFNPEDGGSTVLQNVGTQPPHETVQQPRKPLILF